MICLSCLRASKEGPNRQSRVSGYLVSIHRREMRRHPRGERPRDGFLTSQNSTSLGRWAIALRPRRRPGTGRCRAGWRAARPSPCPRTYGFSSWTRSVRANPLPFWPSRDSARTRPSPGCRRRETGNVDIGRHAPNIRTIGVRSTAGLSRPRHATRPSPHHSSSSSSRQPHEMACP